MVRKLPRSENPVHAILKMAGGACVLAEASKSSTKPIGSSAVHKWRWSGIPDEHWDLVISLAGVSAQQIYEANAALRRLALDVEEFSSSRAA